MQGKGVAHVVRGNIDKDVDFKPERPDEVFGLAEQMPRESLPIPTRSHSNRNDFVPLVLYACCFRPTAFFSPDAFVVEKNNIRQNNRKLNC